MTKSKPLPANTGNKAENDTPVYLVAKGKSFRDANKWNIEYKEGFDVSHFDAARLENLVKQGLVEKK